MTPETHCAEKDAPAPIYCGKTINGPKVGYKVVAWRKQCRQRVKNPGDRCRFHGGPSVTLAVATER